MIRLDAANVSTARLGKFGGIDLEAEAAAWGSRLEAYVRELLAAAGDEDGMLGWLALPGNAQAAAGLNAFAREARGHFTDVVVLGIGGSSLGARAVITALQHPYRQLQETGDGLRVHFIENVDPDQTAALLQVLDPGRTLVNVISKSGSTAETMAAFLVFRDWLETALGDSARDHIVATTDPHTGTLRPLAESEGYRVFTVPPSVGGRFSVLSPVGLLPIALAGIDISRLLTGAAQANDAARLPYGSNAMLQSALLQYLSYRRGRVISVFMPYSSRLSQVSAWFVQLWAESLGKATDRDGSRVLEGSTPLAALGATDQHSQVQLFNEGPDNKLVAFVRVEGFDSDLRIPATDSPVAGLEYLEGASFRQLLLAEQAATAHALAAHGKPNYTLSIPDVSPESLGALLQTLMWQTAIMGELLNIDTYNQPGVELGKVYTYALMGREGFDDERRELADAGVTPDGTDA